MGASIHQTRLLPDMLFRKDRKNIALKNRKTNPIYRTPSITDHFEDEIPIVNPLNWSIKHSARNGNSSRIFAMSNSWLTSFFTDWLDLESLVRFDSAVTNHALRSKWHSILKSSSFVVPFHSIDPYTMSDSAVRWIVVNDVAVEGVHQREPLANRHLVLSHFAITEIGLIYLLKSAPQLESVDLDGCTQLSGAAAAVIATLCPGVERALRLPLAMMTDASLTRLAGCTRLTHLTVSRIVGVGAGYDATDAGVLCLLAHCTRLTALGLSGLDGISDAVLSGLAQHTPHLRQLTLDDCAGVSDRGLAMLAAGCGGLQSLSVAGCGRVTDAGIAVVARKLLRLEVLRVDRCGSVTNAGVERLARLESLRVLGCGGCARVTERGIAKLATANCVVSRPSASTVLLTRQHQVLNISGDDIRY